MFLAIKLFILWCMKHSYNGFQQHKLKAQLYAVKQHGTRVHAVYESYRYTVFHIQTLIIT